MTISTNGQRSADHFRDNSSKREFVKNWIKTSAQDKENGLRIISLISSPEKQNTQPGIRLIIEAGRDLR